VGGASCPQEQRLQIRRESNSSYFKKVFPRISTSSKRTSKTEPKAGNWKVKLFELAQLTCIRGADEAKRGGRIKGAGGLTGRHRMR